MKVRWLSLLVGLLLGLVIGYFGGQRGEFKKVLAFFNWAGTTMTDEGVRLYRKAKGIPDPLPSQPGNAPRVAQPTLAQTGPDEPEYIRQSL